MKMMIIETALDAVNYGAIAFGLFALIVLGALIFIVIKSFLIINPDEDAVVVRLGKAINIINPGTHFCLWPINSVVRYTRKPMIFSIKVVTAMTKNGVVKGYKEDGKEIERTELDITLTLMTHFDNNSLLTTLSNAPGNNPESLKDAVGKFIISVVRSTASTMPWPMLNGDRTKVSKYIMGMIIPDYEYYDIVVENENDDSKPNVYSFAKTTTRSSMTGDILKSPFIRFALDLEETSVDIQNVDFSDETMKKAFNLGESARMKAEQTKIDAGAEANRIIQTGEAEAKISANKIVKNAQAEATKILKEGSAKASIIMETGIAEANARKLMIEEIKNHPDLEYLRTLTQMAQGTSNTILYQIPKAFEEKLSAIMGGSAPENFFSLLKDEKVLAALKKELDKLNT